jgi:hypothetical protein
MTSYSSADGPACESISAMTVADAIRDREARCQPDPPTTAMTDQFRSGVSRPAA